MISRNDFPDDFVWGTATASYQVEGAVSEGGRTPSIWDTFAHTEGKIADGEVGDIADDHYHLWPRDVELMSELGVNAYRFSLSWSRIVRPDGGVNDQGVAFYRALVERLVDCGVAPWATLYHWDLPQWLEERGGWMNRAVVDEFVRYAEIAVQALGDVVKHWTTLNEPWCSAFLGYASGEHAPGKQLGAQAARAAHHLLLGHGLATRTIRRIVPDSSVGISLNLSSVRPASLSEADLDAARRADGLPNRFFLEPVLLGKYPTDVLRDLREEEWFAARKTDLDEIRAPIDFLGINYYTRITARAGNWDGTASPHPGSEFVASVDTGAAKTQMGWEIHPDGLIDVLEQAHGYAPGLPLVITENGSAWSDELSPNGSVHDPDRIDYLERHIAACADAVRKGIPLRGYFVWTLLDNFEWAWGFSRRFGLLFVDYPTQKRTLKSSGEWLGRFLAGKATIDLERGAGA